MILALDAPRVRFETDDHNNPTCPIWDGLKVVNFQFSSIKETIRATGSRYYSSRAGGPFLLMRDGAALLDWELPDDEQKSLANRQKANLSHWIYKHNLENRLFDGLSNQDLQARGWFARWMKDHQDRVLKLDRAWVEGHRNRTPSAEDRMLMFLRELVRFDDDGQLIQGDTGLQFENRQLEMDQRMAAGGCRHEQDMQRIQEYAIEQGWMAESSRDFINLAGRIHVEQRTRELDEKRQGFVAMSFDPCLKHYVFELGIEPALEAAGYEAFRIDRKAFTGDVVDEILAEIRKSRFVVADFTACKECTVDEPCNGAPGGVYYEAGFAQGLDIPVFLTCRKGCTKAVHFDIDHLKRIEWETPEDLQEELKNSILAVLDRGPLDPPDGQPADSRQPERTAAGS